MNHDIVIDSSGDKHQAVKVSYTIVPCDHCSLRDLDSCFSARCMEWERSDKSSVIYKRKVTIKEYINAKQS